MVNATNRCYKKAFFCCLWYGLVKNMILMISRFQIFSKLCQCLKKLVLFEVDPNWSFSFTFDDVDPLLLMFDTYEAPQKIATPAFLMALMLKEHLKAIKAKSGFKPEKLGFCFFDYFCDEELQRVQEGIKNACELLEVGSCFINI